MVGAEELGQGVLYLAAEAQGGFPAQGSHAAGLGADSLGVAFGGCRGSGFRSIGGGGQGAEVLRCRLGGYPVGKGQVYLARAENLGAVCHQATQPQHGAGGELLSA